MPGKNIIKTYIQESYYHIYNRGVEKRKIFLDDQDFKVFLSYLKTSLIKPPDPKDIKVNVSLQGSTFKGIPRQPKNFLNQIELVAYCLMPNHYHLLVKQNPQLGIKQFIQSIATRYSMYFNKKYGRVGALFQEVYKAILITDEPYLLHLTRYIHQNPLEYTTDIINAYSSYGDFLGLRKTSWIKPEIVLSFFSQNKFPFIKKVNSYKEFVENYDTDSQEYLGRLTLEE